MNEEKNKFNITAGTVAVSIAIIGWLIRLRLMEQSTRYRGGIESSSDTQIGLGGIASVLLVVSGILGIYAATKNDGRAPGVIAITLAAIFAFTIIAAIH